MYRAYDTLSQLATQPRTHLVAGHDPLVRARFTRHAATPAAATPAAGAHAAEVTDLTRPSQV
jgi:hypothetical protein